jgi:hypothetical protein
MMITEITAFQNRKFQGSMKLVLPNGGLPFALTSNYVLNFFKLNDTTAFAQATVGGTTASMVITQTAQLSRVEFTLATSLMQGLEGYGSFELLDTVTNKPVTVGPLRFVKEGTAYAPEFGAELVVYAETVVCVVNAYYTGTDTPSNAIDNVRLADMNAGTFKGRLSAGVGDPEDLSAGQMKTALLLSNVDNTSDANKPLSLAVAAALSNLAAGDIAASLLTPSMIDGKAIAMDLINGGYYARDDVGDALKLKLENVPSIVITAPAKTVLNRKRKLVTTIVGTLPKTHQLDATPAGDLIEAAATNLLVQSEDLTSASLSKSNITIGSDQFYSPDGNMTLDAIIENTANNSHWVAQFGIPITPNQPVTFSGFIAAGTRTNALILLVDSTGNTIGVSGDINLVAKTITTLNKGTSTASSGTLVEFSNGLFKWTLTTTIGGGITSAAVFVFLENTPGNFAYVGDGASKLFIGFLQVEVGSVATSYIRTLGTSVVRSADYREIALNGYTSDEFALSGSFEMPPDNGTLRTIVFCCDGSSNNYLALTATGPSTLVATAVLGGVVLAQLTLSATVIIGNIYKFNISLSRSKNTLIGKLTGIAAPAPAAYAAGVMPAFTKFVWGSAFVGNIMGGKIQSAVIHDRALTAAEIAAWVG